MAPKTRGRKGKSDNNKDTKSCHQDIELTDATGDQSQDSQADEIRQESNNVVDQVITEQQLVDEDDMPETISFNQSKENAYKLMAEYSKVNQQIKDIRKEKQNRHQAMKAKEKSTHQGLPLDVLKAALTYKDSIKKTDPHALVKDPSRKHSNSGRKSGQKKRRNDAKKFHKGLSFVDISKDKTTKVSDSTSKFLTNRLFGTRITRNSALTVISNKHKIRGYRPAYQFKSKVDAKG